MDLKMRIFRLEHIFIDDYFLNPDVCDYHPSLSQRPMVH